MWRCTQVLIALNICLFANPLHSIESSLSGYARIIAGVIDDKNVSYLGYDNSLSFDQHSLVGLQGQLEFSSALSATVLAEAHSNSNEDSEVKWLYLKYQPTTSSFIKLGQLRTPFFSKSDVLNVGFSYPWISPPTEVYIDYLMKNFQGIDFRYAYLQDNYSAYLEAYYGYFDGEVTKGDFSIDTEVTNLSGLIGELKFGQFSWRAAYHLGDVSLMIADLETLSDNITSMQTAIGTDFNDTIDSLHTCGRAEFYQIGLEYESLNNFIISEYTLVKPQQDFFPDMNGFYFTVGRHFNNLSAWLTYGNRQDSLEDAQTEITEQINNTPTPSSQEEAISLATLQGLDAGYQQVFAERQKDNIRSWSLGLRWDFKTNTALKMQLKQVKAKQPNNATFSVEDSNFDQKTNILLIGLEWVFE